jgi:hypothetical protein
VTHAVGRTAFIAALTATVFSTSYARGQADPHSYIPLSPSPVRVVFVPESDRFAGAAEEYTAIWQREGSRIVAAMEQISGFRFDSPPYADTAITAIVFEGVSNSGYRDRPMRLRASYPEPTKRATLVHELGHRLQVGVARRSAEDESTRSCFSGCTTFGSRCGGRNLRTNRSWLRKPAISAGLGCSPSS